MKTTVNNLKKIEDEHTVKLMNGENEWRDSIDASKIEII